MLKLLRYLKRKEWLFFLLSLVFIAAQVWLDLKLILRTALVLLTPEESTEAFEDKKTEEKP